uniref:Uncharacterized protein n=1 Tax=Cacopsylla melanoneura TaxID=428564 RepID=A0A8D9DQX7_9HEMI
MSFIFKRKNMEKLLLPFANPNQDGEGATQKTINSQTKRHIGPRGRTKIERPKNQAQNEERKRKMHTSHSTAQKKKKNKLQETNIFSRNRNFFTMQCKINQLISHEVTSPVREQGSTTAEL